MWCFVVLLLLCAFTYFNFYERILQFVGIESADDYGDSGEGYEERLREGAMVLEHACRKRKLESSKEFDSGRAKGFFRNISAATAKAAPKPISTNPFGAADGDEVEMSVIRH